MSIELRIIDQLRAGRFVLALRGTDNGAVQQLLAEVDAEDASNGFVFALGALASDLAELAAPGRADAGLIHMLDRLTTDRDRERGGNDAAPDERDADE